MRKAAPTLKREGAAPMALGLASRALRGAARGVRAAIRSACTREIRYIRVEKAHLGPGEAPQRSRSERQLSSAVRWRRARRR